MLEMQDIPLNKITGVNIRSLDLDYTKVLADNMAENGLINPITVRKRTDGSNDFELIAGFHRFAAAESLKWTALPACIKEGEGDSIYISLSENTIRKDMTWPEQVAAVRVLKERGETDVNIIAKRLSSHLTSVADMFQISELPQAFIESTDGNPPLKSQMRRFARLADEHRSLIAGDILKLGEKNDGKFPGAPMMEKIIDRYIKGLENACFDLGECATCPHNTASQNSLFNDPSDDGTCMNHTCYEEKTEIAVLAKAQALAASLNIDAKKNIITLKGTDSLVEKGEISIDEQAVPIKFWDKAELGEAASGCEGCPKRAIVGKPLVASVMVQPICTEPSCYENFLSQAVSPEAEETEVAQGTQALKASGKKEAVKVEAIVPKLEATSNAVTEYRKTKAIEIIIDQLSVLKTPALLLKAVILLFHGSDSFNTKPALKASDVVDLDPTKIQEVLKEHVSTNIEKQSIPLLKNFLDLLVTEEQYNANMDIQHLQFLERLNRSELLGVLHELALQDEKAWAKTMRAKKTDLVKIIMEAQIDEQFVPNALKLDKIKA